MMRDQVFDIPFELAARDIIRVNRIRLGMLMVLLVFFFWLAHIFLVLTVAALLNTIVESSLLCFFGGFVASVAVGQIIKREYERWEFERASRTAEQTIVGRLVMDKVGLRIVYDRTTTIYGWEDFHDAKNHGSDMQFLLRGGGDFIVPAHLFEDAAEYARFASYSVENILSKVVPLN